MAHRCGATEELIMTKAAREAKQQTTWVAHNNEFEDALNNFVDRTLEHRIFHR